MSDVREQLSNIMASRGFDTTNGDLADAILERFDVTPKPVISEPNLGQLVATAANGCGHMQMGQRLNTYLSDIGLQIVRVSDDD